MLTENRSLSRASGPGQSLVEFALTAPLLVLIVVSVIELGILFAVVIGLSGSAREAARAGAVFRSTGTALLSVNAAALTSIDSARLVSMSTTISDTLSPIIAPSTLTVTVGYPPYGASVSDPLPAALKADPYRAGDTISVTLQHSHRIFWGLFGPRDLLLQASSTAKIEPGGVK